MDFCKNCGNVNIILGNCTECNISIKSEPVKYELRDYQKEAVRQIIESNNHEVILANPMRTGKTMIMVEIAKHYSKKNPVVLLFSKSILVEQFSEKFKDPNILLGAKTKITNSNVWIGTIQSFYSRMDEHADKIKGCVMIQDEVDFYRGDMVETLVKSWSPIKRILASATPYDERGYTISKDAKIVYTITHEEAVKRDYRCPTKYFVPVWTKNLKLEDISKNSNDYNQQELEAMMTEDWYKNSFLTWVETINLENRKTLIYTNNINHCEFVNKILTEKFPTLQIEMVHSKKGENDEAIRRFKNGDTRVLISVSSLTTGFDAPVADTLISLRPTLVRRLAKQILLRASTANKDKTHAEVFDLGNNLATHGFPDEDYDFGAIDKEDLDRIKKESKLNEIHSMHDKEPNTEISVKTITAFKDSIKELNKKNVSEMSINELIKLFEGTEHIDTVATTAAEIYHRVVSPVYQRTRKWVKEKAMETYIHVEKKDLLLKLFKKRAKAVIKERKKFASLYYYFDWLINESFINFGTDIDKEITEDDIPF